MSVRYRQEVVADRLMGQQIPAFDAAVLSAIEEFATLTRPWVLSHDITHSFGRRMS